MFEPMATTIEALVGRLDVDTLVALNPNETGVLVALEQEPGSIEPADACRFAAAFAARVNEVIADPRPAARMGRARPRACRRAVAWRAVADKTAATYAQLL